MEYFLIVGISQGVLLSFLLIYKSRIKNNNAWLIALFILLISGIISGYLLNKVLGEPIGSFLVDPLILLIGPSFYLYIQSFSRKPQVRDYFRHGAIFLLYLPLLATFYAQQVSSAPTQPSLQAVYSSGFAVTIGLFKFLHLLVYVYLSFAALQSHRHKVEMVFADLTGKDLAWLRYMLGAFVFLVMVSLVLYVVALRYLEYQNVLTFVNLLLLSVFILTLSFYAFHQNTLFDYTHTSEEELKRVVAEKEVPKYEKSGLKAREVESIKTLIEEFISQKGYRNPQVTLGSMAEQLGVYPHRLSEVLGKHMGTSFYDLINQHRIEDIKQAIHDPALSHLTLLSIAYDFGYNSKSTFNTAFRKFTGTTPSEYKSAIPYKSTP